MKNRLALFLRKLIVFTLILAVAGIVVVYFLPKAYYTPTLPYLYLFFFSVTLIIHYLLLRISGKSATGFINYFMLLTFGKLIFLLSILLIYALLFRYDAIPFIVTFFILYAAYTAFEIILSLAHLKDRRKTAAGVEKEFPAGFNREG